MEEDHPQKAIAVEMEMEKNAALGDHEYGTGKAGKVLYPMPRAREEQFKWTEEETRRFLELRRKHIDKFFLGKRGAIQKTYTLILEEMGLLGQVTPSQARKKWNNMAQLYKRLATQPRYKSANSKEYFPLISWQYFGDVEKTIELEPHVELNPECTQIDSSSLEALSDQLTTRIIQVSFPPGEGPVSADVSDGAPPPKRMKKKKREDILQMIGELSDLNRQQEEILATKNKLTIALLSQLA